MRRALTVLAGAVLALLPLGTAHAQAPQPTVVEVAKACGTVTLTFTGPDDDLSGTHGFRWNAVNGNVATGEGSRTGTITIADYDTKSLNIDFAEDEFDGVAAVTVSVDFGPNRHLQPSLDIYPVDTDCLPPVTSVPPTTTPSATTTPATTTAALDPTLTPDTETDGDFDQIGPGAVPSGAVATGG